MLLNRLRDECFMVFLIAISQELRTSIVSVFMEFGFIEIVFSQISTYLALSVANPTRRIDLFSHRVLLKSNSSNKPRYRKSDPRLPELIMFEALKALPSR